MSHERRADDLEWLAFRYVAGVLDATEARAFEERLGADQDAREAVGQAVALGLRLAAARPDDAGGGTVPLGGRADRTTRQHVHRWVRPLAWRGAGIAAGLVFLVYAGWTPRGTVKEPPPPALARDLHSPQRETAPDVAAWIELRRLGEAVTQLEQQLGEGGSDDLAGLERDAGTSPVLPDWIATVASKNN